MSLPSSVPPALPTGFDPTGFVGEVAADGQRVRVAAIATDDDGRVVLLVSSATKRRSVLHWPA